MQTQALLGPRAVPIFLLSFGTALGLFSLMYAVVNVNAFENVSASLLRRASADFEGEETDARLARRTRNWIADVHVTEARA